MIVDAVEGLGEALVSGHVSPEHIVVDRGRRRVTRDSGAEQIVLRDAEVQSLLDDAWVAEAAFGCPLDLEWAIDHDGKVHWLQARPITTLPRDLNELDVIIDESHVHTWCNIGEMMPGAVTPLTYSVVGRGIDFGMQRMYAKCGLTFASPAQPRFVAMRFNHFFLDLTELSALCSSVAGSTKEQLCLALCGRDVAEVKEPTRLGSAQRARNGFRYARELMRGRAHHRRLERLVQSFDLLAPDASASERYRRIDDALPKVWEAFELHLLSSATSGAIAPIMVRVLAGQNAPTAEHHAQVAQWLSGARNVESADIAEGAERIIDALDPSALQTFGSVETERAHQWLSEQAPANAASEYAAYLKRHGHRAVRELELRQPEWRADPTPLIKSLQSGARGRLQALRRADTETAQNPSSPMLRALLRLAHDAVRRREATKSLLVATVVRFKEAYRALGSSMVAEGLLGDADLVFFLSHDELGQCIDDCVDVDDVARARRDALEYQMPLRFEQVCVGPPNPIDSTAVSTSDGVLYGKPVSRGTVTGIARVVHTLEEASAIEPGEILIAPITDVGWTPYFNLIAGLACDVGSAVSHGAVVAREYGLPAVVDLRTATGRFQTGDRVVLDGDRGTLCLADPVEELTKLAPNH